MPWHLSNNAAGCSGWAVIKDSDGSMAGCHKTKAMAQAHMAALYANTPDAKGIVMGDTPTGDREVRVLGLEGLEIRHSGRPNEGFTLRGYAAVYNQPSLDLGGFTETISEGAFDEVLATDPDVHLTWDHDTRYVAARTKNNTLSLSSDSHGLLIDAQVGNYTWAKDLRSALERGDIDQGSFAFTVADGGDEFTADDDGKVTRTITNVGGLYDVTVTAQGAYPQTSMAAMRSLAAAVGRPPEGEATLVAEPETAEGESESHVGSVADDEDFAMWHAAMEKKAAAVKATLAKSDERLGILNERENAGGASV